MWRSFACVSPQKTFASKFSMHYALIMHSLCTIYASSCIIAVEKPFSLARFFFEDFFVYLFWRRFFSLLYSKTRSGRRLARILGVGVAGVKSSSS